MNLAKYRDTQDFREILRLFQKSSHQEGNLLWQNIEGKRRVYSITHLEIDFVSREVVVFLERPQDIVAGSPLYFKLACNDTIFKHGDYLVQADGLSFKFPKTLKTWELRSSERFLLDESEEFSAVLSASAHSEASQQLKVRLLDFSASGLGLAISELNKHIIRDNPHFWVHAINDFRLSEPMPGKVAHLSNEAQGRKYRFGIQLEKALPIEAVKSILS